MGHTYFGVLVYADDITLLTPSASGLKRMINICNDFCSSRGVRFNATKSVCIRFSQARGRPKPDVELGGSVLEWSRSVKHLGSTLTENLSEEDEVTSKRGDLFGRVNSMMGNLRAMPIPVLLKIFDSQCCHLYGCQAWRMASPAIEKMRTAFNRSLRRIMRLPPTTHRALLPLLASCRSFDERLSLRVSRMLQRMGQMDNDIGMLSKVCLGDSASISSSNQALSGYPMQSPPDDLLCTALAINELLFSPPVGFTREESQTLAHFLCSA